MPFISQYSDDIPSEWRSRACGVTALAMAMATGGKSVPVQELIEEGLQRGAYLSGIGWKHSGLVNMAANRGFKAYRKEFRRLGPFKGFPYKAVRWYLRKSLAKGIVPIVSLSFDEVEDTHLVALTGFDEGGWFYNDSSKLSREDGFNRYMSDKEFARLFRRLAIFIYPNVK